MSFDWINTNSISGIALTLFAIVIAGIGKAIVDLYQVKHKADEAKDTAAKAAANTENISNGFAGSVDKKLDRIIDSQMDLRKRLENHLEWHVEQTGKEK